MTLVLRSICKETHGMRLSLHDVDYIEMQLKCNNAHAGVAACRLRISIYLFVTVKWLVENGNFVCIWLLLGNRKAWNEGLEVRNKLKYDVDWVAALLFLFHAWVPVCYAYGGSQQVAQRARTLAADWMEEATPHRSLTGLVQYTIFTLRRASLIWLGYHL